MNDRTKRLELLLGDIWTGVVPNNGGIEGWGGGHGIFGDMVRRVRPGVVVEVGSWCGQSASNMAYTCKSLGLQTTIVCVDTWLGGLEAWRKPEVLRMLELRCGHPTVYERWLANMHRHRDMVLPLSLPSNIGAKVLRWLDIKADLVYIDGSHEYEDVKADIEGYLPLLTDGGVMFGHDMDWDGVRRAVEPYGIVARDLFWVMTDAG